ncbi:Predicted small integral membrane protein [Mycobacteroides abscessus]|nr:Predicted small integral membrane protein [Mycobacteroides abscessus]
MGTTLRRECPLAKVLRSIQVALVSLLMLFIIQHTTNRDTNAVLLKLDELISAIPAAHEEAIDIEDREIYEQEEVHHRLHHEAGQDSHDDAAGP